MSKYFFDIGPDSGLGEGGDGRGRRMRKGCHVTEVHETYFIMTPKAGDGRFS